MQKILLIEDDLSHIELIRRTFQADAEDGFELNMVQTIQGAKQFIENTLPDLIISDYSLPDGKGTDLIRLLKETLQYTPLIILTSQGDERVAVDAMKAGAMDYIVKSEVAFFDMPHIARRALREWQYRLDKIKADQALRESEEKYRQLIESLNEGIWVVDANANSTFVNGHLAEILGESVEHILKTNVLDFLSSESAAVFKENFKKCRQGIKSKFDIDFNGKRKKISAFMSMSPMMDKFGNYSGAIAGIQDITIRKQMEAAVRASDKKFKDLVENINEALFTADGEGVIIYISPIVKTMLGYTPSELIGHPFTELIYQPDAENLSHEHNVLAERALPVEFRVLSKLGGFIWTRISSRTIIENHRIAGYQGVITNISTQKKVEAELVESQEKFRALTENSKDIIIRFSRDLRFVYVSPAIEIIADVAPGELLGKTPEEMGFDSNFVRFLANNISNVFNTGRSVRKEYELNAIHGKITLDWQLIPEYDPAGLVHSVLTSARDVTQQKSAERMIREREELFRQLFDQRDEAVILLELDSRIVNINRAAKTLYGYKKSDFLKSGLPLFMGEDLRNQMMRAVSRIEKKGAFSFVKTRQKTKDKQEILVDIDAKLIKLQGRNLIYCVLKDVTDQVTLEEETKAYQTKLIQENKMASLGTLVSGVAHEVNNPTNFIMFNAPLLQEVWADAYPILREYYEENGDYSLGGLQFNELSDSIPELFAGISDGAQRIKHIVDNLKGFARPDQIDQNACFCVNDAIHKAVTILRPEIRKHTDHFQMALKEGLPEVQGSRQQIEQVLINLIMNALQALSDKDSYVKIETSWDSQAHFVIVDVSDNGVGIDAEGLTRLLDPFYTTKHQTGGTGLGLSISYAILKEHRGSLDFQSEPGAGTRVSIQLPVLNTKKEDADS